MIGITRHESVRNWTLAIIGSALASVLGIGVFFAAHYQGPMSGQVLSLVGAVMIISGVCFGIASIICRRNYKRLHPTPHKTRQETGRPWKIGIALSTLLILGGGVVLYFPAHFGPYANVHYAIVAFVMIIIGGLGEWMCISLLREFNKYRRPQLPQ